MRLILGVLLATTFSGFASGPAKAPSLVGTWVGNRAKNDFERVVIRESGSGYQAHIWAFATFEDIDWGTRPLVPYAKDVDSKEPVRAIGEWPSDVENSTVIFHRDGRYLVIEVFSRFKDRSGRHGYYFAERLRKR